MSPIIFQKLCLFGRSSRETYGNAAIGYVCLKRDENFYISYFTCSVITFK